MLFPQLKVFNWNLQNVFHFTELKKLSVFFLNPDLIPKLHSLKTTFVVIYFTQPLGPTRKCLSCHRFLVYRKSRLERLLAEFQFLFLKTCSCLLSLGFSWLILCESINFHFICFLNKKDCHPFPYNRAMKNNVLNVVKSFFQSNLNSLIYTKGMSISAIFFIFYLTINLNTLIRE